MTSTTVNRSWAQRQRMAVLGLLTAAALVGCSGASGDSGDAAGGTPSPSRSSASPSPTATPTAAYKPASAEGPAENVPLPVMPEEAKVQSKEGLEAFARYWYEAANYGYETGDVSLVRAISSPDCMTCTKYYEVVENGFKDGDWMAKSQIEVQGVHSDFVLTPENRYQALVQLRQDDMEYYGSGGQHQGTTESRPLSSAQLVECTHDGAGWIAVNITTITAG